jgi:hypothetical protein
MTPPPRAAVAVPLHLDPPSRSLRDGFGNGNAFGYGYG